MPRVTNDIDLSLVETVTGAEAKRLLPEALRDKEIRKGLNAREFRFVAVFAAQGFKEAGRAYKLAGYEASTPNARRVNAHRLLQKPKIQKFLRQFLEYALEPYKSEVTYRLTEVYIKRAFYDLTTFYESDGETLKPLNDIPEEWRVCIDGIDRRFYGKDADREVKMYKLADRPEAMAKLAQFVQWISGNEGQETDKGTEKKLRDIFNNQGAKPERGLHIV
jgi:phage terminase small subunit